MSAENKAIVGRLMEEIWNHRKLEVADELVASTFTHSDTNSPDLGTGPEAYKKLVNLYKTAFPDLHFTIEEMISDGEKVATRWKCSGTHKGDLGGIAPTNKAITIHGITIDQIKNGKVVGSRVSWDALGMMQQLGIVPAVGKAKEHAA